MTHRMPRAAVAFVRLVDRLNYGVGRFAMYLLFVLMAILMWSSLSKAFFNPSLWTLEMAQFVMVAYYILGGPYAMQNEAHVRMDLFYAKQSPVKRAWWDGFTVFVILFYLGVLIWGAAASFGFSLGLQWSDPAQSALGLSWPQIGRLERSPTAWRPYMWPIKLVMLVGFVLMLLQALSSLIKDIATIRGETI
jgi:TRAP-type mannitol/chloroaromatic compound transport system permease small subunit